MERKRLIRQAIQTPDGTILESRHRHDFRTHVDSITKERYIVDGGLDYRRGTLDEVDCKDLCIYLEDGIELVRKTFTWGTYGKNGDEPYRQVKLCNMSDEHIQACLETQFTMHPHCREAFLMEQEYRKRNGIIVAETL